jgi:hypothetical protein
MKSVVTVIAGAIIVACLSTSPVFAAACCDPAVAAPGVNSPFPKTSGNLAVPAGPVTVQSYGPPAGYGGPMAPRCGGCPAMAVGYQTNAPARQSCCSAPNSGRPAMPQTVNPASVPVPNCCAAGGASTSVQRLETATPIARFTSASSSPMRATSQSTRAVYGAGVQTLGAGPFGKTGYFPGSSLW